jgi:hypothetical protein
LPAARACPSSTDRCAQAPARRYKRNRNLIEPPACSGALLTSFILTPPE